MPTEKTVEKTLVLEVIAPSGILILGYGTRAMGETFVLPESKAKELLEFAPLAFKLVAPMPAPKPIEKESNRG